MDKQYSIQFFTRFVEAMQKFCRDYLDFEQTVELSGYLSLEIDNYKKERYVLSEMIHSTGDVMSESYCVKAFKTMKRLPPRTSNSDNVLRDNSNAKRFPDRPLSQDTPVEFVDDPDSFNSRGQGVRHSGQSQMSNPNRSNISLQQNPHSNRRNRPSSYGIPSHTANRQTMQIQPRQSNYSDQGDNGTMLPPSRSDEVSNQRAKKRGMPQAEEHVVIKRDKPDVDLDSLYGAATNILSGTESTTVKSDSIVNTVVDPSNNSSDSVSTPQPNQQDRDMSESVRLPIPDAINIKEEQDDIVLLDSPQEDSTLDFDTSLLESSYLADDNSQIVTGYTGDLDDSTDQSRAHNQEFQTAGMTWRRAHDYPSSECAQATADFRSMKYCDQCSFSSTHMSSLNRHKKVHKGSILKCSLCPKQFYSRSSHDQHLQGHAGKLKCKHCPYQTDIGSSMRLHNRQHTGDLFRCSICPSYFYQKSRLDHHLKAHAGLVKCPNCGKQYGSKEGLKYHNDKCHASNQTVAIKTNTTG